MPLFRQRFPALSLLEQKLPFRAYRHLYLLAQVVASNAYVIGRSKEVWADDAEIWKPERWHMGWG